MSGMFAFFASLGLLCGWVYVFANRMHKLEKTNTDLQHQLDDLKRRLEELERKQ